MPKFNFPTILILAILLLACELAIISPVLAYNDVDIGDISPSAVTDDDMITSSSLDAGQLEDLYQRCVVMLGDECGDEIFDLIFRNDSLIVTDKDIGLVSKYCCDKLLNMGRNCHDQLVNVIAQTTHFSTNSSATVPRSSQVWDLCSLSSS
ncbi:protein DOWN-REGULATED IN DIF1 11-like [Durio zibethinus]|uniref:Protein DOWN-REGULATED IN DIF1 11-like n=1 Tax=Durio zibethinus TaxID=66656 RepID=A0A6P5XJS4_DURZI|nr:protein DOWN-REGULATED IN DIF1 11-like [Durio zibethinus]